jgi:hypothetical protein
MEIEQKQSELVEQFVALAKSARGRAAAEIVTHATSHRSLFAFAEILAMPHILEVSPSEFSNACALFSAFLSPFPCLVFLSFALLQRKSGRRRNICAAFCNPNGREEAQAYGNKNEH